MGFCLYPQSFKIKVLENAGVEFVKGANERDDSLKK